MSSPHPRGSSLLRQPPAGVEGVVPAPAGVFRGRAGSLAGDQGRPRTRGGLPGTAPAQHVRSRSSPHPRGSSPARQQARSVARVVPAPAGVFPPQPKTQRPALSRPRTRGGLPLYAREASLPDTSSPHPRGSSALAALRRVHTRVVPAPAGVFRRAHHHLRRPQGRPRTRGGLPSRMVRPSGVIRSSPHPRGSSGPLSGVPGAGAVVPAPAGVFPNSSASTSGGSSRPRTRGGLPAPQGRRLEHGLSSPHPRGSSCGDALPETETEVVPAPAGVFRPRGGAGFARLSRPRTRGGLPFATAVPSERSLSSPHPRGSSSVVRQANEWPRVVPAPAGVFRRPVAAGRSSRRRPRTRGGLPRASPVAASSAESSPHPRGSSDYVALGVGLPEVVPAPAGVFRRRGWRRCRWRRRPRTRGGLPLDRLAAEATATSSPHPRGSSSPPHRSRPDHGVVPAPAGVFRPASSLRQPTAGRPRTRGGLPPLSGEVVTVSRSSPHPRGSSQPTPR